MDEIGAANAFGAMAHETRLKMLKALVVAGPGGLTAGDVAKVAGASPSRASFHLAALAKVGLISSEKRARQVIFRAEYAALGGLVAYFLEECCSGQADVLNCCGLSCSDLGSNTQ